MKKMLKMKKIKKIFKKKSPYKWLFLTITIKITINKTIITEKTQGKGEKRNLFSTSKPWKDYLVYTDWEITIIEHGETVVYLRQKEL